MAAPVLDTFRMAQLKAPPFKFEHRAFEDLTPISFAMFSHSRHFARPPPDWEPPSFQTKRAMSPSFDERRVLGPWLSRIFCDKIA